MTAAGLRSLFRHHRHTTGVTLANPHRFRHTFASDMLRAGVSLPALMQLMGHADIQTTMLYVQVTPQEVYLQYARAVSKLDQKRATSSTDSGMMWRLAGLTRTRLVAILGRPRPMGPRRKKAC